MARGPRILVSSNLDARAPFGQSVRPFFLSRGLAKLGAEVGTIGRDSSGVQFGPTWSLPDDSLWARVKLTRHATASFNPDVIYAHQTSPALAAVVARPGVPVVADFHALGSMEWLARAKRTHGKAALAH